jgi:hypothetical protein
MTLTTSEVDEPVSLERGEVDRRIYSDPMIFELEIPVRAHSLPRR